MKIRVMKSVSECKMPMFINLFSKIHRAALQLFSFFGAQFKGDVVSQSCPWCFSVAVNSCCTGRTHQTNIFRALSSP